MTTPEEIAARREATEQPKPETTGVFDTFVHPCLMCGTTVHVVDGQAQPHECADLPAGDNLAYAWWQGYDTAKAAVEPKPAVEWLGESVQAQQDDLRAILDALGISTHARPYSPHEVVQREVLPAVRDLAAIERERDELRAEVKKLRLAKGPALFDEMMTAVLERAEKAEARVARVEALRDEWRQKRNSAISAAEARSGLSDAPALWDHAAHLGKRILELRAALEGGDDE